MKFTLEQLRADGFAGFVAVQDLRASKGQVPDACGVYVVIRVGSGAPTFIEKSPAGWFKGQDPSRLLFTLEGKWVPGASLVYIGKAGPTKGRTLRRRISELLDFGAGLPKAHRGGSALWQLADAQALLVGWKPTETLDPREVEKAMLAEFREAFGSLPYANFQS